MSVLKTYRNLDGGRPTTRTYHLDLENKRLGRRIADTVELEELIGKRRGYVEADIRRRLEEALFQDDRITGVRDFHFSMDRENAVAAFTVETIFGDVPAERRFTIGHQQIK